MHVVPEGPKEEYAVSPRALALEFKWVVGVLRGWRGQKKTVGPALPTAARVQQWYQASGPCVCRGSVWTEGFGSESRSSSSLD